MFYISFTDVDNNDDKILKYQIREDEKVQIKIINKKMYLKKHT